MSKVKEEGAVWTSYFFFLFSFLIIRSVWVVGTGFRHYADFMTSAIAFAAILRRSSFDTSSPISKS